MKKSVFWFRRDLRFDDNIGLNKAIELGLPVLPIFIFDQVILSDLLPDDPRVNFIYEELEKLNSQLKLHGSSLLILKGDPMELWSRLVNDYDIEEVFYNKDYEPYGIHRDDQVSHILKENGIPFHGCKDQVIHEESEVLKQDGTPYTVFTPYKRRWLECFKSFDVPEFNKINSFCKLDYTFPSKEDLGIKASEIIVQPYTLSVADEYAAKRDFPVLNFTSALGPHLRFGTISIRQIIKQLKPENEMFLSELIWREFFMQILFNHPRVVSENFRVKYDQVEWINNPEDFEKWKNGETGFPMVDAGMRQLNKTGYMHNRLRMVTAGFLCKHLLIDWRWGEAYFAQKLLDFELSSNNGNWQWAAGTGCDAAPYFRVFNPETQHKRFDPDSQFIREWIPEYGTSSYVSKMVDHDFARKRAVKTYKEGLGGQN
jgi:deoxyribodipyrimidine photo-lyase